MQASPPRMRADCRHQRARRAVQRIDRIVDRGRLQMIEVVAGRKNAAVALARRRRPATPARARIESRYRCARPGASTSSQPIMILPCFFSSACTRWLKYACSSRLLARWCWRAKAWMAADCLPLRCLPPRRRRCGSRDPGKARHLAEEAVEELVGLFARGVQRGFEDAPLALNLVRAGRAGQLADSPQANSWCGREYRIRGRRGCRGRARTPPLRALVPAYRNCRRSRPAGAAGRACFPRGSPGRRRDASERR